jgi:hypothetical protein
MDSRKELSKRKNDAENPLEYRSRNETKGL